MVARDKEPETPEEIRATLEYARRTPLYPAGDPWEFMVLGYLAEECGIPRPQIREQLVAIDWPEALARFDADTAELSAVTTHPTTTETR